MTLPVRNDPKGPSELGGTRSPNLYRPLPSLYFLALHVAALSGLFLQPLRQDWIIFGTLYLVRTIGITLGYHRLLAHRSFRVPRVLEFALACLGASALQKGPLWWAYHHRLHHRSADTSRDPHTPRKGWFYSHIGWILSSEYTDIPPKSVPDLRAQLELLLLDRWHFLPALLLAATVWLATGRVTAVLVGVLLSTVATYHAIFASNSLAHRPGRRRSGAHDDSQNNWLLAILLCGDGWHADHHAQPGAARHWTGVWSVDVNYLLIWTLAHLGLATEIRVRG